MEICEKDKKQTYGLFKKKFRNRTVPNFTVFLINHTACMRLTTTIENHLAQTTNKDDEDEINTSGKKMKKSPGNFKLKANEYV